MQTSTEHSNKKYHVRTVRFRWSRTFLYGLKELRVKKQRLGPSEALPVNFKGLIAQSTSVIGRPIVENLNYSDERTDRDEAPYLNRSGTSYVISIAGTTSKTYEQTNPQTSGRIAVP